MIRKNPRPFQHQLKTALALAIAAAFAPIAVFANPAGPTVTNGSASFSSSGNTLTIVNTPGTIINWQQFNIGQNELTRFIQQSSQSTVLNRVTGLDPSQIFGTLQSNGKVFLINPNGIMFGPNAVIDVFGLVASNLNLSDADFLAGRFSFNGGGAGAVVNQGAITTPVGGSVYLIGSSVTNQGLITSPSGQVLLAAGQSVSLADTGTPNLSVTLTANGNQAVNLGQITAQGGQIDIYGALIDQQGILRADSADVNAQGQIVLKATQSTNVSGTISATNSAGAGGSVEVLGDQVTLASSAKIDVSGASGGGTVLVGGDTHGANGAIQNATQTNVAAGATINADATESGNGGKVIVWADDKTFYDGFISARGGPNGGDGGFVETSGRQLEVSGTVTTYAPKGKTGNWLLDPAGICIDGGFSQADYTCSTALGAPGSYSYFTLDNLNKMLAGGTNVTLAATDYLIYSPLAFDTNTTYAGPTWDGLSLTATAPVIIDNGPFNPGNLTNFTMSFTATGTPTGALPDFSPFQVSTTPAAGSLIFTGQAQYTANNGGAFIGKADTSIEFGNLPRFFVQGGDMYFEAPTIYDNGIDLGASFGGGSNTSLTFKTAKFVTAGPLMSLDVGTLNIYSYSTSTDLYIDPKNPAVCATALCLSGQMFLGTVTNKVTLGSGRDLYVQGYDLNLDGGAATRLQLMAANNLEIDAPLVDPSTSLDPAGGLMMYAGNTFINNAGPNAIQLAPGVNWLLAASSPANVQLGGLTANTVNIAADPLAPNTLPYTTDPWKLGAYGSAWQQLPVTYQTQLGAGNLIAYWNNLPPPPPPAAPPPVTASPPDPCQLDPTYCAPKTVVPTQVQPDITMATPAASAKGKVTYDPGLTLADNKEKKGDKGRAEEETGTADKDEKSDATRHRDEEKAADERKSPGELKAEAKQAKAKARKADAEAKKAEAEAKKADAEAKRADAKAKHAEAEAKKADAAATKADADGKKAEADSRKADDEAKQAKTPESKASAESRKADAESRKADAQARKTEVEAKKVDADAKKDEAAAKKSEAEAKHAEADAKKADAAAHKAEAESKEAAAQAKEGKTPEARAAARGKADDKRVEAVRHKATAEVKQARAKEKAADADHKQAAAEAKHADAQAKKADAAAGKADAQAKHAESAGKKLEAKAAKEKEEGKPGQAKATEGEQKKAEGAQKKAESITEKLRAEAERQKAKAEQEKIEAQRRLAEFEKRLQQRREAEGRSFSKAAVGTMAPEKAAEMVARRHEFKMETLAPALNVLARKPDAADMPLCSAVSGDVCVPAQRMAPAVQAPVPAPTVAYLPQVQRKVAVLIGIDHYQDKKIPSLESAVPDVEAVSKVLRQRLGYEVEVVRDATKADIVRTINHLSRTVGPNDSVAIYYAGHGYLNEDTNTGYWIPSDGSVTTPANWINNNDISRLLNGIPARQVMLVSDSCYSGSLIRMENVRAAPDVQDVLARRSVTVMTSGGEEPVSDEGRDGHSIFAWSFMKTLNGLDKVQAAGKLFGKVKDGVTGDFPQVPHYGADTAAGHAAGGDYLFEVRRYK